MASKPTQRNLQAWQAFLSAHSVVVAQLERELREEQDLPLSVYEVLLWLRRAPARRLRMHELADSVLLTPSGLTRVVDRMEQQALVRRHQAEGDRRGRYVELTDQGLARLREASPVHLRGIQEHFASHLTAEEGASLRRALEKVSRAAGHEPFPS